MKIDCVDGLAYQFYWFDSKNRAQLYHSCVQLIWNIVDFIWLMFDMAFVIERLECNWKLCEINTQKKSKILYIIWNGLAIGKYLKAKKMVIFHSAYIRRYIGLGDGQAKKKKMKLLHIAGEQKPWTTISISILKCYGEQRNCVRFMWNCDCFGNKKIKQKFNYQHATQ